MTKNENCERILFTIKELDVLETDDGNLSLKIKVTDEISKLLINKQKENVSFINRENFKLTNREKEVLYLLSTGKNNSQIAKDLCVSVHTAKAHVANILQKLSVEDRVQAAIKAISEKLIDK